MLVETIVRNLSPSGSTTLAVLNTVSADSEVDVVDKALSVVVVNSEEALISEVADSEIEVVVKPRELVVSAVDAEVLIDPEMLVSEAVKLVAADSSIESEP